MPAGGAEQTGLSGRFAAEFPSRAFAFDGDRTGVADLVGERQEGRVVDVECGRHPHTSFGTERSDWMSAQL